jgi:hypothetical protein
MFVVCMKTLYDASTARHIGTIAFIHDDTDPIGIVKCRHS